MLVLTVGIGILHVKVFAVYMLWGFIFKRLHQIYASEGVHSILSNTNYIQMLKNSVTCSVLPPARPVLVTHSVNDTYLFYIYYDFN